MGAYLIDHPPVRDQFYRTRNRPLTGCTVLHTAESVMDTVGPDTGAEAVAEFIRTRTTAGSYHDLADSDSWLRVVPLESGAYHDATGSNNWALSISFACRTTDWDRMSPEKLRGFLRNGARAFADQQAWRRARGFPLTELRRISKAQSDRGESGFIYHGDRDPGRRTDPGVSAPNDFPFDEFIRECAAALGIQEDDMPSLAEIHDAVWHGTPGAKLVHNHRLGRGEWAGTILGALEGRLANEVLPTALASLKDEVGDVAPAQPGPVVQVSAADVAQALAGNAQFVAAIGEAVAAATDRRARDGDPATGPAT